MEESLSKKLSFYNFICTVFIVIYHSRYVIKYFTASTLPAVDKLVVSCDLVGSIAMGSFFTISGFLFYLGLHDRASLIKKLKKRVFSLLIPFVAWNTLMLIQNVCVGWYSHDLNITLNDIVLGYTFYTFNGGFWYLLALIFLLVLSPAILLLKNKPKLFLVVVALSFVGAFYVGEYVTSTTLVGKWFTRLVYYIPLYFLGAYFGLCKDALVAKRNIAVSIISALLSVAIIVLYMLEILTPAVNWILLHILPISLWLTLDCALFAKIKITYPMKATFFVYAMHMYLIDLLVKQIANFIPYHSLRLYLSVLLFIAFVAAIYLIAVLVSYCAKRILPEKIYSALSGGRVK